VKFDLVGNRHWFFIVSGALAVLALIILAIPPVLRPGNEFTSGTTTLIRFQKGLTEDDLRAVYASLGHSEARIQTTNAGTEFLIRTRELAVPAGSFSEAAPTPPAASTPVGPQPVKPLGTLKLGKAGATGDVQLRTASAGDVCNFGDIAGTAAAGTEAQVTAIYSKCGEGEKQVYEVVAGGAKGLVLAGDTTAFQRSGDATTPGDQPAAQANLGERGVIE
jgi:hypothetical protein